MRTSVVLTVWAVGLSAVAAAAEPDWPQFRGPSRDNVSKDKGLLKKWPEAGPPVAWKAKGIGSGYSSVAVAGQRVYTLGNKGQETYLHALDRADGKLLWSVKVGRAGNDLGCTPTVDGDNVYCLTQAGELCCVSTADRKVVWTVNFHNDFGGKIGGWKYCESPLVDGDNVICTPGGPKAILAALNKKTGEVVWKAESPFGDSTAGYSSVVIANVKGVKQYVQLTAAGVVGVAARDGKVLWSYDKLGPNTANIPTPVVLGNDVLAVAGYGKGGALLRLSPTRGGTSAKEVYFQQALTNKHGGVVAVGGYVYGDSDDQGRPYCIEVKTGKLRWKRARGPGSGSAAVTYADGHLYFLFQDGTLVLAKASPKAYEGVSSLKVKDLGTAWAHPVVVGGKLYVRGDNVLYCYDVKAK